MNALDSALVYLNEAANILEQHAPTAKQVEKAKDASKAAAKVLDAAFVLMSCNVYEVALPPIEERFNDPTEHRIEMPEVREEIVAGEDAPSEPVLPQLPEDLRLWDSWSDEDQAEEFSRRLEALDERTEAGKIGAYLDAWDLRWDEDSRGAFVRLLVAEARETLSMEIPSDEERDAWLARFAPVEPAAQPDPEHLVTFRAGTPDEQIQRYEALLNDLEDAGVREHKLKRKDWKSARAAWMDLFIAGPEAAWNALWHAYHTLSCNLGFAIPTQEQIDAALTAAPAEEEIAGDPMDEQEGGAE